MSDIQTPDSNSTDVAANCQLVANATMPATWQDPVTGKKLYNEAYMLGMPTKTVMVQTPESRDNQLDVVLTPEWWMNWHAGGKRQESARVEVEQLITAAVQQSNRELLAALYGLAITTAFNGNDDKAIQIQAEFGRKAFAWLRERQQAGEEGE